MSMRYPGGLIATNPVNQQYPSGVWTGPQTTPYQANNVWANDSSFKNTTLLLHGDGATTSFTKDASTNNFQVSLVGDTKPNNLTPFITNGYWSNYFNGSSTYLSFASNAAFAVTTTADYTVEGWINFSTVASGGVFQTTSNPTSATGPLWFGYYSGNLTVAQHGSATYNVSYAWTPTAGVWYHVAATRTSGTVRLFINGALVRTDATTQNGVAFTQAGAAIGLVTTPSYLTGYLSNVRYVNGSSLYTAAFTPPTTPLTAVTNTVVLSCQSNRFIDNSANAFAITANGSPSVSMQQPFTAPSGTSQYGSGYFDGTGDYLTTTSSAAFNLSTSDWTVQGWYYPTAYSAGNNVLVYVGASSGDKIVIATIGTAGNLYYLLNGSVVISSSTAAPLNAWSFFALVRSGSTTTLYLNGVSLGTYGSAPTSSSKSVSIGADAGGAVYQGYISNVRILNGTANATVPTAPFTPVTNTSLLTLQTNGPENNNGFLDSSPNSFPITRNGNITQGSFTPYEPNGYWSMYSADGYMTASMGTNGQFGTGDFCVECWLYPLAGTTGSGDVIWTFALYPATNGVYLSYTSAGQLNVFSAGATRITGSINMTISAWNHVAVTRSSGTTYLYLNGIQIGSSGSVANLTEGFQYFGRANDVASYYYKGYASNFRVVKGSAVYTANFTPPTAPLTAISGTQLLAFQSNRFTDNSSNAYALTISGAYSIQPFQPFTPTVQYTPSTLGGSAYSDGTTDWLSSTATALTQVGSSSFTTEVWCYCNSLATAQYLYIQQDASVASNSNLSYGISIAATTGNMAVILTQSNTRYDFSGSVPIKTGAWHHIALVRNGNVFTLYMNGVSIGTTTQAITLNAKALNYIGTYINAGASQNLSFNGYLCDFRIIKGTALYTTTFTPPTAPLTPIANTQMLCSMQNAAIFDNSGMGNLETVGNAQIDTSVVKYGTSSMYFDGSGDWLIPSGSSALYAFGTGDFTIEFWIYIPVTQTSIIYDSRPVSTQGAYPELYLASNQIIYYHTESNRIAGSTLANTTWYHIALCRSGTSTKLFVNGTQVGSTYSDSTNYLCGTNRPAIGVAGNTLSDPFNGYLDDLRITKGVARYVTNFTPPVARMPNQ